MTITNTQDSERFPKTTAFFFERKTTASNHMTGDSGTLVNLKPYNGHDSVMVGIGDLLKISHPNTFLNTTHGKMVMKQVLLVPGLKKNLLFVIHFTNYYPCKVEFSNVDVVIKDKETQNIMIQGSRRRNLYALDDSQPKVFFIGVQVNRYGIGSLDIHNQRWFNFCIKVIALALLAGTRINLYVIVVKLGNHVDCHLFPSEIVQLNLFMLFILI